MRFTHFILAASLSILFLQVDGQITIDNSLTVQELVQDHLIGDGVQIENVTFNGMPGDMISVQAGLITGNSNFLSFNTGVVLCTDNVNILDGTGFGDVFEGINDPDLNEIAGGQVFTPSIIEFDFLSTSDSIRFNYVFGSIEYEEYVCSGFNDVFAFLLSGPGITGPYSNNAINIALIPGTDIPVAINTVNPGVAGSNGTASTCEAANPNWVEDSQYYVSNVNGTPGDIFLDGFTTTLTALADVDCGVWYHIKLAVGNILDTGLDSGVFLEAGSFAAFGEVFVNLTPTIGGAPVIDPQYEGVLVAGCSEMTIELARPPGAFVDSVQVQFGGTAIEDDDYVLGQNDTLFFFPDGVDTLSFTITTLWDEIPDENEVLDIFVIYPNSCGGLDTAFASIPIVDPYSLFSETEDVVVTCPADSTLITAQGLNGISPYLYYWNEIQDGDTIGFGQTIFADVPPDEATYYVLISDACNFETIVDSVTVFNEIPPPLALTIPNPEVPTCPGDDVEITAIVTDGNPDYTFIWNPTSADENTTTVNFETSQMVYLEVIDICGTTRNDSVLAVYPVYDPIVASFDSISISCPNDTVFAVANVEGGAGVFSYAWFDANPDNPGTVPFSTSQVAVFQPGIGSRTYTLQITDQCGEQDRDENSYFYLFLPVDSVSVVDEANCAGTELRWAVAEVYGGEPPFEFFWAGPGLLQELDTANGSALFTRPENEPYAISLIDRCAFYPNVFEFEPDIVYLDRMPNVLTPNDDNKNDFLAIEGIDRFPGSTLEVWDRWGKSVFKSTDYRASDPVVQTSEAFTGKDLNNGTYFYILSISGGECVKSGYITLLGSND